MALPLIKFLMITHKLNGQDKWQLKREKKRENKREPLACLFFDLTHFTSLINRNITQRLKTLIIKNNAL
ncbi:hypothetical protein [Helicobacter pylori]|uniref:hypothetical protein n=1 Tax=Helicobacter pylori TaxID=210 RepID=UPI0012ADE653|nr:hypothetical protein [Helicobacter pylori]